MTNADRIIKTAIGECRRQKVDFRSLIDLLSAYEVADTVLDPDRKFVDPVVIFRLASLIEPVQNEWGYRNVAVTFKNGGTTTEWSNVPRAMERLTSLVQNVDGDDDINVWIKSFLFIHPFIDGNGRVAWILYNWLKGTLEYPLPLPDYEW